MLCSSSLDGIEWDDCGLTDEDFMAIDIDAILNGQKPDKKDEESLSSAIIPCPHPSTSLVNQNDVSVEVTITTNHDESIDSSIKRQKVENDAENMPVPLPSETPKQVAVYKRKKIMRLSEIPLHRFRFGTLWVTNITAQFWCEQQMAFDFDPPEDFHKIIIPRPEVTVGKSIHLARELEIQDVVQVRITSREDRFALKVLGILEAIHSLVHLGTPVRREIPIFGVPFGMNIFVVGIIDEIRLVAGSVLDFEIVELKTRTRNSMPEGSQKMMHRLQVMLYKKLFDDLVRGRITKEMIRKYTKCNLNSKFGADVMNHLQDRNMDTLDSLLDFLFQTAKSVPFISSLLIQYELQEDSSLIGVDQVYYDENWLENKIKHAFSYWKGEREAQGVDIEDSWKCNSCNYKAECRWRSELERRLQTAEDSASTCAKPSTSFKSVDKDLPHSNVTGSIGDVMPAS